MDTHRRELGEVTYALGTGPHKSLLDTQDFPDRVFLLLTSGACLGRG